MESNRRAGSNYIAHLLVFNEQPPTWALAAALRQNLFLPHDTICRPDNEELCRFLVGDPVPLEEGCLVNTPTAVEWGMEAAWLAIALMQAFKNTQVGADIKRIILKVRHELTENLLACLGELPAQLTQDLSFQVNTMLFSSVPEDLQMIWVNEKSSTPTEDDNHITVDLLLPEIKTYNIEDNYLYDKIMECCREGDTDTLLKIVRLFTGLNFNEAPDYEFAYQLMRLAQTSQELDIDELDDVMLGKLSKTELPAEDKRNIWEKIEAAVNKALNSAVNVNKIARSLDVILFLNKRSHQKLNIEVESCHAFMDFLFGMSRHLDELFGSNTERLEIALMMAERVKDNKCPEDVFFRSLQASNVPDLWERFILFYYGKEKLPQNISQIVRQISKSGIEDKSDLASRLFPVKTYYYDWLAEIKTVPGYASIYGSLFYNYFIGLMPAEAEEVITRLQDMPKETAQVIGADGIIATYMDYLEKSQIPIKAQTLKEIQESFVLSSQVTLRVSQVLDVLNENELQHVDTRLMRMITKLIKKKNYSKQAFLIWFESSPDANDIIHFIADSDANESDVAYYLDHVWKKTPQKHRTRYVLQITDQMSSIGISVKQVRSKIRTDELRDMLKKQNTFIRKILRKCKSFLFQNTNRHK